MKRFLLLIFSTLTFLLPSCRELIIEKDISKSRVQILAPADSVNSSMLAIGFWWEEVDNASSYRLQVVSPSFDRISSLVLDTLVSSNQFTYSFSPGYYGWRVRAENTAGVTSYSHQMFSIDSNLELSNQKVILNSPQDNLISANGTHLFSWDEIGIADSYRIDIEEPNGTRIFTRNTTNDTVSYNFSSDGSFVWKVQALGNNGKSTAFTSRSIIIDRTAPGMPLLKLPGNDSVISSPVSFSWEHTPGQQVTQVRDSIYIYSNPQLTILINSAGTTNLSHQEVLVSGNYYWRVRSFDMAGNKSPYSSTFHFFVP